MHILTRVMIALTRLSPSSTQADKKVEFQDLMMEMHTQEADNDKEKQELQKEIARLQAQLDGQ